MQSGKHKVAGHGRVHGDFRGFIVADFTDHDNIRILAQKGAKSGSKSKADFGIDLALVDAFDAILNRILNGADIHARLIEYGQDGIQGRGFTRTGRTGDKNHAVRFFDGTQNNFFVVFGKAEFVQSQRFHALW